MFRVWTSEGDFDWAREAWAHLSKAGLTREFGYLDRTLVSLRLVTLAKIYQDFSGAKWDENPDDSFSELASHVEVDPLALGLFAGSNASYEDWETFEEEFDLREVSLAAACEALRPGIFECLSKAYGGTTGLYIRLSMTCSGVVSGDDSESDEGESADDLDITGPNMDAYEFVTSGFRR
jgi:hypothetical protein